MPCLLAQVNSALGGRGPLIKYLDLAKRLHPIVAFVRTSRKRVLCEGSDTLRISYTVNWNPISNPRIQLRIPRIQVRIHESKFESTNPSSNPRIQVRIHESKFESTNPSSNPRILESNLVYCWFFPFGFLFHVEKSVTVVRAIKSVARCQALCFVRVRCLVRLSCFSRLLLIVLVRFGLFLVETVNVLLHISPSSAYADSHNHILTLRFSIVFLCSLGRLWERSLGLLLVRGIVSSASSRS